MSDFNDIGISRELDWPRIRKLMLIGIFGALLNFAGDMILGWGVENESLEGFAREVSVYTCASDGGIFAAAILGLFGVTLEGLSCFGIYRLIAAKSPKYAHSYRAGIFGYVIFGACGFHMPVCALAYLAKQGVADEILINYAAYFMLPGTALFWIFFTVMEFVQIRAFAGGCTPYPKWCAVFSMPVGMALAVAVKALCNNAFGNAVFCAWISIGCLWMFGGLLAMLKKVIPAANRR